MFMRKSFAPPTSISTDLRMDWRRSATVAPGYFLISGQLLFSSG